MTQPANNNQNNANNAPQQAPSNPFASRPSAPPAPPAPGGSRFGSSQPSGSAPQPGGSPFGRARTPQPAPPPNHREWTIQPARKTVVRFDLVGLGDPFMRLLGAEPNADYANLDTLAQALEQGGEQVDALRNHLNDMWQKANVQGAALVWRYDAAEWKTICYPPLPQNDNDDESSDSSEQAKPRKPLFNTLRAIDPSLVMNVLLRSRSQLMIASTPLTFDAEFLCATLMSDDPRLVKLALTTGCLEE